MSNLVMCPRCGGSGIGRSGNPDTDCSFCNGEGGIILRDERGRFMKYKLDEPKEE